MKCLFTLTAFILMSGMVAAQSWNNPSKAFIEKALNGIVLPQIEYEHSSGLEVLEFIRYRVWDAHLFDKEAPRVAFEFRCSPGLLLKEVTFKAKNISCGEALNGVCRKLEITWAVEQGKIVFTDSKKKKTRMGISCATAGQQSTSVTQMNWNRSRSYSIAWKPRFWR